MDKLTDYERIHQKLLAVGAVLMQSFDDSNEDLESDVEVEFWAVGDKAVIVVSYSDGDCGLYAFVGKDGDPVENDLAFIDFLNRAQKLEKDADEMIFDGLLRKPEFFKLQEAIRRGGAIDEDELCRLTKWASQVLTQAELLRMLMDGWLTVGGWNGDAPDLQPSSDTMEFIGGINFDQPMLEEMTQCRVS